MELRHLRYFVAVADLLHFGRAAASLRIAQPSLSHQIRQLETELETLLLLRTKRRVQLTEAGRVFLQEAREILGQADRAALVARRASHGEAGTLRVGLAQWMDTRSIIASIDSFCDRHPAIHVDLQTMPVPLQIAALRERRLDAGFVRPPLYEPSLASELLMEEPFVVAMPAKHAFASRARIPTPALADQTFILVSRAVVPVYYDLVLQVCREAEFVPHAPHELDDPQLVLGFVAAGMGVSLVPASVRWTMPRGIVFVPLVPPARVLQTAIAWRKDNTAPLVGDFLDVVRRTVRVSRSQAEPIRSGD